MILISSMGAKSDSWLHYPRMKGQMEDAVTSMGFDRVVILRPALLNGDR